MIYFLVNNMFTLFVAMTVGVFLVEKSGRLLNLEDGRNTTAGTINKIMAENLSLAPLASQVFCIWLISPLLRKFRNFAFYLNMK